jgi:hypothetical protein
MRIMMMLTWDREEARLIDASTLRSIDPVLPILTDIIYPQPAKTTEQR